MTADMAAIERMLKADSGKKTKDGTAPVSKVTWDDSADEQGHEKLDPGGPGSGKYQRPAPGSEEELLVMQTAWADPEFRKQFYDQYGDKLEAAGIKCDGSFPGMDQLSAIPGQAPDQPRGLTITPEPGFVIKTKTLESNEKVFINFCK